MELKTVLPNLLQIAEGLCWPIALYFFFRFSVLLFQRRLIIRDSDKSLQTHISEFLNSGKEGRICILKGAINCGDSLVAPFTEKPCIAWKASLAAQYDTRVRDSATDSYAITMATDLVSVHSPEKWLRGISIQALMFFLGSLFFLIAGVLINAQG